MWGGPYFHPRSSLSNGAALGKGGQGGAGFRPGGSRGTVKTALYGFLLNNPDHTDTERAFLPAKRAGETTGFSGGERSSRRKAKKKRLRRISPLNRFRDTKNFVGLESSCLSKRQRIISAAAGRSAASGWPARAWTEQPETGYCSSSYPSFLSPCRRRGCGSRRKSGFRLSYRGC